MTTLFKAITRTTPKPVNENHNPVNTVINAPYTRLSVHDVVIGTVTVTATASVAPGITHDSVFDSSMTALPTDLTLVQMAEKLAKRCLNAHGVQDVTISVKQSNQSVEIFRKR
jgi:hypothetical protein